MKTNFYIPYIIFYCVLFISFSLNAQNFKYKLIVKDLINPWGFTFLPDNSILITEKKGELIHFKNGKK